MTVVGVQEKEAHFCSDDLIYVLMQDGRILWNRHAEVLIERLPEKSFEYWIAKKLWDYESLIGHMN